MILSSLVHLNRLLQPSQTCWISNLSSMILVVLNSSLDWKLLDLQQVCIVITTVHSQLLKDSGFLDCKPMQVPLIPNAHLDANSGDLVTDSTAYHRLVGWLLYSKLSWSDITFVVHQLSQFLAAPQTYPSLVCSSSLTAVSQSWTRLVLLSLVFFATSCLHRCRLGNMPWFMQLHYRFLCLPWWFLNLLAFEETNYGFSLLCWG